jgi:hypothetical protein
MLKRAYYQSDICEFLALPAFEILGSLTANSEYEISEPQRYAWAEQISHLHEVLKGKSGHIAFEFVIPRVGKRVDVVLLMQGVVYVVEYKVGSDAYDKQAINQVYDYALDLKNFHSASHSLPIVPILVATDATAVPSEPEWDEDQVARPCRANANTLHLAIASHRVRGNSSIDPHHWINASYKPTPTIVEAARALYEGNDVEEISHSEGGAINLSITSKIIEKVIEESKRSNKKSICFVTGVPGSGKTLAGLNIATRRQREHAEEHTVFLSGNGPLVTVLRESLTRDAVRRAKAEGLKTSKKDEARKTNSFIQNVHHFRDECLRTTEPPIEQVVIFDEAQRAWTKDKTSTFMRIKKGVPDFGMSEPHFLLDAMDRHPDWCVVICIVGGGQEINGGEAGLGEWLRAINDYFPEWEVIRSDRLGDPCYQWDPSDQRFMCVNDRTRETEELHLSVDLRSFRAESLADFVEQVVSGDSAKARVEMQMLERYPIVLTRNVDNARVWLRERSRGTERIGLVASSNAIRLRPLGLHIKAKPDPIYWFLNGMEDVRSSYALEELASEFEVQGLELDWVGVCWDGNMRWANNSWSLHKFSGTTWRNVNDTLARRYLVNAYRVLLTRARQGMVIYVPYGDELDATRKPEYYDGTYSFLQECGIESID